MMKKQKPFIYIWLLIAAAVTLVATQNTAFATSNKDDEKKPCACGPACKCAQGGDMAACKCKKCGCKGGGHMAGHGSSVNPFLKMMEVMMVQMDSVPLSGSAERDFLAQMIPHHQGAVEMAKYEIEHGTNFEMKQLAKSILAEQQGEIMEMKAMMANYPSPNTVNPAYKMAMDKTMETMMATSPTDATLPANAVDCCFALVMLPHHQAAVDMATALIRFKPKGQVAIYAQRIIGDQQIEIEQMREYINNNCKK